ncbi:MAG: GNAT family N-acetyltransferase [Pseudomonadota bacterium]
MDEHLSRDRLAGFLKEDAVIVAEDAHRLVGFVQIGSLRVETEGYDLSNTRELRRLYVLNELQNHGIGARLMGAALSHPSTLAAEHICLDVWEMNAGAVRFYERHGFRVVGERVFEVAYGEETDPDLVMRFDRSSSPATAGA